LLFLGADLFRSTSEQIQCDDGNRKTIDLRKFTTEYYAYSLEFEATLSDKAKFSGKLSPVLVQELSESMQHVKEFQKSLVAGFNACAISKVQYAKYSKISKHGGRLSPD